jgi:nucleotide-binding universal stress UspA family protein
MNPIPSSILCATDFSPGAKEAAAVAVKVALGRSAPVRLVYASDATNAGVLTATRQRLDTEAQRLRQMGATVDPLLLERGRPAKALLDHVRSDPPGLIVVASGVKAPIDRWVLGSFSEQIAESSPVPTLVVRNPAALSALDWRRDRLTILLALDLTSASDAVLRWAKEFRIATPCDLISCYVNRRMPTVDEAVVPPGRPVNPPALQSWLERELQKKVRDQLGDDASAVVVRPYFGDPGPCIFEIAGEVRAHLIAVGTHQRHGLTRLAQFSVSRELLHQSAANVVCVPVTTKFDPRDVHIPDFRRVLVATDFSDLGNAAIPFACAACSIGGLVRIIHVAPPRARSTRHSAADGSDDLAVQLRALIPNETGARCQPPQVGVLQERDVAQAICAEAERFGADLVCVASHGLGASRALHGSVTKAILKKIRRPLLVIRRPDE